MKNADDAIERVLTGLRDAEAPRGMERRILAAMEDRAFARVGAPARAAAGSGWRLPLWFVAAARPKVVRYAVMGLAATGVIAVVFAIPSRHRSVQAPVKAKVDSVVSSPKSPEVEEAVMGSEQLRVGRIVRTARVANEPEGPVIGPDADSDAVALSETRAASFPAPPMPLTDDERLLLRMVQRGEPVELAMLDPQLRALQDAKEKEEFQRFFAKPVVKDAAVDGSGAGQGEAGSSAQSSAEPAAEPVAAQADGVSPAAGVTMQAAPEKSEPVVANPEKPNGKELLREPITTVEKD